MKPLNPELEKQVGALAEVVCDALNRTGSDTTAQARPLVEALVRGGYARLSDVNLQYRIEAAVVSKCAEVAIHRRGEVGGITREFQQTFDQLVAWHTQTPRFPDGSQAANISAATDA